MDRAYPAKVLLFGEHTVLRGGSGLAVPYPRFALRWKHGTPDRRLIDLAEGLEEPNWWRYLDLTTFRQAVTNGWFLEGNIPLGYGLGSSGAVCAAIFDRFRVSDYYPATEALRRTLAKLEGHFHGESSGTDPLVSYLDQPVLLGDGSPREVLLPDNWQRNFFLYDTGKERQATPFIRTFTERYDGGEGPTIKRDWTAAADAAVSALIDGDRSTLKQRFREISTYQLAHFSDFIPESLHDRWQTDAYALKLCGAGGGGMMLGWTDNREAVGLALGEVAWLAEEGA